MHTIESIGVRRILNSHLEFVAEFIVRLPGGVVGTGAAPRGETIGIHETAGASADPVAIVRRMELDGRLKTAVDQSGFDGYLQAHVGTFGRSNTFGLSMAFFNATRNVRGSGVAPCAMPVEGRRPRLCCNILNGGRHAYTNAVLSDFPEFLLVAASDDVAEVIAEHGAIQRLVRERLSTAPKTVVAGNPVSRFAAADNRECLDLLLSVRDALGLSAKYDPMIDASAGDLRTSDGYVFQITDHSARSAMQLLQYWQNLAREYGVALLEDPFHEQDTEWWRALTLSSASCRVVGDNLYCSGAERIALGAAERWTHGVVIKPDQAGTVTAARDAVTAARQGGQLVIASHRSVSTEETYVSVLACAEEVPMIKIGPLTSDFSSVMRLNEIIRLTEVHGP